MMTRRRSTTQQTATTELAKSLGRAWAAAETIQRRYPRIYAAAVADALELDGAAAADFISAMEQTYVEIENSKTARRRGFT